MNVAFLLILQITSPVNCDIVSGQKLQYYDKVKFRGGHNPDNTKLKL